jgi:hypothetical protein
MGLLDVFRSGPSEAERNWTAPQESDTANKAVEFNLGDYPEIQKYLKEKGSTEIIGDRADTLEGMQAQYSAMEELTRI